MAKQNLREKLIRGGLQRLEDDGLGVEAPSPAMIAALQERFGNERATDLAIVHLLGRIADPGSLSVLAGLSSKASDKDVKREIRRSLFKLAQRGITGPENEAAPKDAAKPKFSLTPDIEGYLSPVDGGGNYLLVLARPQIGGGLLVIQAAVNDRQGLHKLGGNVIRRKEFREMMGEMKAQHQISMVPIPWEYADWRLHTAYERARAVGTEGIEDYPTLRSHLTTAETREQTHPVYSHIDGAEVGEITQGDADRRLLEEPEFNMWLIEEDLLAPYVERAAALQETRIVLNATQKEERLQSVVKEAVRGIFLDDAMGPIFARRLEDVALHLVLSQREEKARSVLGVVLALERKELGGLLGTPLLEELVRRSLALYMAREKEKPDEPSLIIKP